MPYCVRPMCKGDIIQITEIDREAFPSQWPPANYRRELQNKLAHYIVACDDTKMIEEPGVEPGRGLYGLVSRVKRWFNRDHSASHELPPLLRQCIAGFAGIWIMADEAHITNIAVRESYQRQGIGELLLISIIDLARELNAGIITLEVRASNTAAQKLYSKHGLTQVGLRRGYYTDNREDGIIMSTENIASASFQAHLQQARQAYATKWGNSRPIDG